MFCILLLRKSNLLYCYDKLPYTVENVILWCGLDLDYFASDCVYVCFFFSFCAVVFDFSTYHCSQQNKHTSGFRARFTDLQTSLFNNFSLKMGSTALFTHLKIILLQYFQFSVFSFNKISFIQTELETF